VTGFYLFFRFCVRFDVQRWVDTMELLGTTFLTGTNRPPNRVFFARRVGALVTLLIECGRSVVYAFLSPV